MNGSDMHVCPQGVVHTPLLAAGFTFHPFAGSTPAAPTNQLSRDGEGEVEEKKIVTPALRQDIRN